LIDQINVALTPIKFVGTD